jgi:hypothetical protein
LTAEVVVTIWVKRHEVDSGVREGVTTSEAQRFKELEREVKGKQWDGRPHPRRHRCAKVEALINHLNREGTSIPLLTVRDVADPGSIRRGRLELPIQHIRPDRQGVPAVGGVDELARPLASNAALACVARGQVLPGR